MILQNGHFERSRRSRSQGTNKEDVGREKFVKKTERRPIRTSKSRTKIIIWNRVIFKIVSEFGWDLDRLEEKEKIYIKEVLHPAVDVEPEEVVEVIL